MEGLYYNSVYSLAINSNDHIFADSWGGGIFRSTNEGGIWVEVSSGIRTRTYINCLSINPDDYVFAGTSRGIYRTTDNGKNWFQYNNGLPALEANSLGINSEGFLFAGIWDHGIFLSSNNGESWDTVNNGLTNYDILALAANSADQVFAGTDDGVFLSTNYGKEWIKISTGLKNIYAESFAFNINGYVFMGTYGHGVYRSRNSETSVGKSKFIPSAFCLEQNYPNPFNLTTKIKYAIGSKQFVILKVFDILGRRVTTLVNEEQPAGNYEVTFNASDFARGI